MSIARGQDELAALNGPMGTEAYMAPEQAIDGSLSDAGPWTDVWGLGATLYEAANGHRPFRRAHKGEPPTQLSEDPRPITRAFRPFCATFCHAACNESRQPGRRSTS